MNGKYNIHITEELHEVSYLDQVQLIAVDHPNEQAIYTNDKFSLRLILSFAFSAQPKNVIRSAPLTHAGWMPRLACNKSIMPIQTLLNTTLRALPNCITWISISAR